VFPQRTDPSKTSKNVETRAIRNATTGSSGFYIAPNLLPGNYDVETSASGSSTNQVERITLAVGRKRRVRRHL